MDNQSINDNHTGLDLENQPFQNIHHHNKTIFVFSRPLHLNLIMLVFGALLTFINGGLLVHMHKRRNQLKAKRFIFVINLTFCDLTSGLILISLATLNAMEGDGPWVCLLQGESCLSLCLTMCSYTCSIIIQFIAVRYPIYYKTTITRAKIGLIILGCWAFSIGFSCAKVSYALSANHHSEKTKSFYFFPFVDLTLKITYVLGNCACFIYVLKIALQRRRQQEMAVSSNQGGGPIEAQANDEDEKEEIANKSDERTPFRRQAANFLTHYQAIVTSGLRLTVYIFTSLPLTIFCAYVLIRETTQDKITYEVFWESRDLGVALVLLWFSRAIIDPLITMIREKPVHPRRTSTMNSNSGSTRLTSFSHSRASRGESLGFQQSKGSPGSNIRSENLGFGKGKDMDKNENNISDREV